MTDNDGRVTLAVISNQIENIQTDVGEINGKMDETNKTLNGLTVKTAVIEKGQESFDKAIEGLQQKSNRNDVFVVIVFQLDDFIPYTEPCFLQRRVRVHQRLKNHVHVLA